MSASLNRAARSVGRKRPAEDSSDEDSDSIQAVIDEAERKQQEKRALKEKRAEYTSLKKKLDDQCAINARQLKALAAKRNEYPVLWFIKINCLVAHCNFCVLAE